MSIAQVRIKLVSLREDQRTNQRDLSLLEAQIQGTVEGKNEAERKASFVLKCALDRDWRVRSSRSLDLQTQIERLEAEIENARDARREYEWSIRERLVDALERNGMPAIAQPDQAFDETIDHYADRANDVAVGIDEGEAK